MCLVQREYKLTEGFVSVTPLATALREALRFSLELGRFRSESWIGLEELIGSWYEESLKLQKFELLLQIQFWIPGMAVLLVRCLLGEGGCLWYSPSNSELLCWICYFCVYAILHFKRPYPSLLRQENLESFLVVWMGGELREPWRTHLEEREDEAWRLGRCPQNSRERYLHKFWSEQSFKNQKRLMIWEEAMPVLELCLFLFMSFGLCFDSFLQFLGPL